MKSSNTKNWGRIQNHLNMIGVVLNEEDKKEIIYKNINALKRLIKQIYDRFQFGFIKSKENFQIFDKNDFLEQFQSEMFKDLNPEIEKIEDKSNFKQKSLPDNKSTAAQITIVPYKNNFNLYVNKQNYTQKLLKMKSDHYNENYIKQQDLLQNMELVNKITITQESTFFEIIIHCLKESFGNNSVKNLVLLANHNQLLKDMIEKGKQGANHQKIFKLAKLIENVKFDILNRFLNTEIFNIEEGSLLIQFLIIFLLSPEEQIRYKIWEIIKDLLINMSNQKEWNYSQFLNEWLKEDNDSLQILMKFLHQEKTEWQNFIKILLNFGNDFRQFFVFAELCQKNNTRSKLFSMINNQWNSDMNFGQLCNENKSIFNFLLVKSTSIFFSFGLKLENGFETYSFVEKIHFKEFNEVSRLILNLLQINRYKLTQNLKTSFIDKVIQIFEDFSLSKNNQQNIKNIEQEVFLLFINYIYKVFHQEFDFQIKLENFFIKLLENKGNSNYQNLQRKIIISDSHYQSFLKKYSKYFIQHLQNVNKTPLEYSNLNLFCYSKMITLYLSELNTPIYLQNVSQFIITNYNYYQIILDQFLQISLQDEFLNIIVEMIFKLIHAIYEFEIKQQKKCESYIPFILHYSNKMLQNTYNQEPQDNLIEVVEMVKQQSLKNQQSFIAQDKNIFDDLVKEIAKEQTEEAKNEHSKITNRASKQVLAMIKDIQRISFYLQILQKMTQLQNTNINKTIQFLVMHYEKKILNSEDIYKEGCQMNFLSQIKSVFKLDYSETKKLQIQTYLQERLLKFKQEESLNEKLQKIIYNNFKIQQVKIIQKKLNNNLTPQENHKKLVQDLSRQSQLLKQQIQQEEKNKFKKVEPKTKPIMQQQIMQQGFLFRDNLLQKEIELLDDFYQIFQERIKEAFQIIYRKFKNHSIFKNDHSFSKISKISEIKEHPVIIKKSKTNKQLHNEEILDLNLIWRLFVKFTKNSNKFQDFKLSMYQLDKNLDFSNVPFKDIVFQMFYLKGKNVKMVINEDDKQDFLDALKEFLPTHVQETIIKTQEEISEFEKDNKILSKILINEYHWPKIARDSEWIQEIIYDSIKDIIERDPIVTQQFLVSFRPLIHQQEIKGNLDIFEKLYSDYKIQQEHYESLLKKEEDQIKELQKQSVKNIQQNEANRLKLYQNNEKEKVLQKKEKHLENQVKDQTTVKTKSQKKPNQMSQEKEDELKRIKEDLIKLSKEKEEILQQMKNNQDQKNELEEAKKESIGLNKKIRKLLKMMNEQKKELAEQKDKIEEINKKKLQEKELEIQKYKSQNLQQQVDTSRLDNMEKEMAKIKEENQKLQEQIQKKNEQIKKIEVKNEEKFKKEEELEVENNEEITDNFLSKRTATKKSEKTFLKTQQEDTLDEEERKNIYLFYHPKIRLFFSTNFQYFEKIYNNLKKSVNAMQTSTFFKEEVPYSMDQDDFIRILHFLNLYKSNKELQKKVREYGTYSKVRYQHYHLIDVFRFIIFQLFFPSPNQTKTQNEKDFISSFNELSFLDNFLDYFDLLEKNLIINNYFRVFLREVSFEDKPNIALNEFIYQKIIEKSKTKEIIEKEIYTETVDENTGSKLNEIFLRMENIQKNKDQMIETNDELEQQIDKIIIAMNFYFFVKRKPYPQQVQEKINLNNLILKDIKSFQFNNQNGDYYQMIEFKKMVENQEEIQNGKMQTEQIDEYERAQRMSFLTVVMIINEIVDKKKLNEETYENYKSQIAKIMGTDVQQLNHLILLK